MILIIYCLHLTWLSSIGRMTKRGTTAMSCRYQVEMWEKNSKTKLHFSSQYTMVCQQLPTGKLKHTIFFINYIIIGQRHCNQATVRQNLQKKNSQSCWTESCRKLTFLRKKLHTYICQVSYNGHITCQGGLHIHGAQFKSHK